MLWPYIVPLGVATYLTRGSVILFRQARPLPAWLEQTLSLMPLAVLSGLISQSLAGVWPTTPLFVHEGLALFVGGLLCWITKRADVAVGFGMIMLPLLALR